MKKRTSSVRSTAAAGSSATSEPPTRLDHVELASLLQRKVKGESFPHSFIHEVDPYSAAPSELVQGREHAPGDDHGDGKGLAWYFCGPAKFHNSDGGGSAPKRKPKRKRKVAGGKTYWNGEGRREPVLDQDGKSVGVYKIALSYVQNVKNRPGMATRFTKKRLGWCMVEIGLDGANQQLVLCKVYRSPRTDPVTTSTQACSAVAEDIGLSARTGISEVDNRQQGRVDSAKDKEGAGGYMPRPPLPPAASTSCYNQVTEFRRTLDSRNPSGVAIVKKARATSAASVVIQLGGSSIPSPERMKEMAKLVLSFESPVVVLSAMGNTTPNILLAAWKALCGAKKASEIHEFAIIKELHLRTVDELGLDRSTVSGSLYELEQHLEYAAMTKELTPRTRDYLVSFGDRTSTQIFKDYLNKLGNETLEEWNLLDVNTLGGRGSDFTAATICRDLGLREIQVWKDVDGVLTCDPKVCAKAIPIPYLTFDEADELRYFAEQSMQIAMEGGISVIVKNSYHPQAHGTVITRTRDMSKDMLLTSIVLKSNVTIINIERTSMIVQHEFFKKFVKILASPSIVCPISEGKMSVTLGPSKFWNQESTTLVNVFFGKELVNIVQEFEKFALVRVLQDRSVISLVGNGEMSSFILETAISVLGSIHVYVENSSQGPSSSKVGKISLTVYDSEAKRCVQALHSQFFELNGSPVLVNSSSSSSSSSDMRKADDSHPAAPLGVCCEWTNTGPSDLQEVERMLLLDDDPVPTGGDSIRDWQELFFGNNLPPSTVIDDGVASGLLDVDDGVASGVLDVDDYPMPVQPVEVDDNLSGKDLGTLAGYSGPVDWGTPAGGKRKGHSLRIRERRAQPQAVIQFPPRIRDTRSQPQFSGSRRPASPQVPSPEEYKPSACCAVTTLLVLLVFALLFLRFLVLPFVRLFV